MSSRRKKEGNVILIPEKNSEFVRDADNLMKVDLNIYKQLVTIRQWKNGDEEPREYRSAYVSAHQGATEKQEDTEKQENTERQKNRGKQEDAGKKKDTEK